MKINVVSDLHLEHGYQELPGGEVLILAGDICETRDFQREFHQTRLTDRIPGSMKWVDFFYHECSKYDKVFYVMGNHEHYHSRYDKTQDDLKNILPRNVKILEKEYEVYNGVLFLGTTLWTDCNNNDPVTLFTVKQFMNDFKLIKNFYKDRNVYYKLTPEFTVAEHRRSRDYIKSVLAEYHTMPTIVITHHGPSTLSINEKYKRENTMNGAYVSDLSELILDNEQIRFWIHGHLHDAVDYEIGKTRVVSNPRGYHGYEDTSRFLPNFTIEI